jgi:hypothetical protein
VLGRSRFLAPAQKLLEEICDVGAAAAHVDRSLPDEGLLDGDPTDAADGQDLDNDADRAEASDAGPMSGAEQQWKKTRLISMMEEVRRSLAPRFLLPARFHFLRFQLLFLLPPSSSLFRCYCDSFAPGLEGRPRIFHIAVTSPMRLWPLLLLTVPPRLHVLLI